MREFMHIACLLAAALLLAGCGATPKPTPTEIPLGDASQEAKITMDEHVQAANDIHDKANELHAQIMKRLAGRNADDREVILVLKLAHAEITTLKRRVAELEGQQIHPPEWVDVRDLASGAISVRMSGEKGITIHHDGGSWCNVWAGKDGIHWEVCK